jgi:toluene monooxygenase system protein A
MEEWVMDQFMKNLEEFGLDRPWFWDTFVEELDYAHHSLQLGLYRYRTTLWFDVASPNAAEREWLQEKYPEWRTTFEPMWDRIETAWLTGGEAATMSYALPAICNLCQLPALFMRPGGNTACTFRHAGRTYLFCSEPCRWIFQQQSDRFASHRSVVDRVLTGEAPGDLLDLHAWMGLVGPADMGQDLRRGLEEWRMEPVPTY